MTISSLSVKNLVKKFSGNTALDHLSLQIEAGKITGIIGPNGSGKSTLIQILTGLVPYDHGEICVFDEHLKIIEPHTIRGSQMTRTFQEVRLFEQMTVLDNLLVLFSSPRPIKALFSFKTKTYLERIRPHLENVGLWEKRNNIVLDLSYGQRKLLEIVRVLLVDAKIIFFDEPFAGLSPIMVENLKKILIDLRSKDKAVILVEHNMEIIRSLSDIVYVLDAGKLLASGTSENVLANAEVREAYLGE